MHILFVPKQPYATLNDVPATEAELLGRLMLAAADYARGQGFAESGYRLVMNVCLDRKRRDRSGQHVEWDEERAVEIARGAEALAPGA